MWTESDEMEFELIPAEVETLRRAAADRGKSFDPQRRKYTKRELLNYGLVREAFNRSELHALGYAVKEVTSLDNVAAEATRNLSVGTPFAEGVQKWQLPIDMMPFRPLSIVFPPGSTVKNHFHPPETQEDPGGALRVVTKGSIAFRGKKFTPGEWFFIPNGVAYEFSSDPREETRVLYLYRFFGAVEGNRFSHPQGCD